MEERLAQRRDGTTVPVLVADSPIYGAQNLLMGSVSVSVDITERKRSEEALEQRLADRARQLTSLNDELRREVTERQHADEKLRESESRFRLLAEAIPQHV